jgi:hypothetical protein
MSDKTCPNCGNATPELLHIDASMKGVLAGDLGMSSVPESVCPKCYSSFGAELAKDAQKKSRRIAKEQHRLNLWRSRVHLIREARDRFSMKDFPGAVVAYEKYFRVLEIIYETKPNEIKVSHFNNSARSKEMVVIASAYWDLMRIYDQSKRFNKRLDQCAEKLGEFLPFTPVYAEISRKIEEYRKVAKNREAFEKVIVLARKSKKRCFIATAAFESPDAPPVIILSRFRDQILAKHVWGRVFIQCYYFISPATADLLDLSPRLRGFTRRLLSPLAQLVDRRFSLKSRHR